MGVADLTNGLWLVERQLLPAQEIRKFFPISRAGKITSFPRPAMTGRGTSLALFLYDIHAGPVCQVGSRRTKENPDSIPSVGVTELASIVVTTMADDEVKFMQTDVFVNYCVYLCVQ